MTAEMIKLTGLWKQKDKEGKSFLMGTLNPIAKLLVLPNSYKKEGDKSPDYFIYMAQNEKKQQSASSQKEDDEF